MSDPDQNVPEDAGTRIHHPSKHTHHLGLLLGLLGAVAVATGLIFYSSAQEKKKRSTKFDYTKPVPSDADLRRLLTDEQYRVTRQNGTETIFHNDHWDNFDPGIYVDVITGEPLFSSLDKFDGKIGLPTFSKPISNDHVVEKSDSSFEMQRTEVRARRSDSHLGHVFNDGPPPTGRRYCVNSAAMRFISIEKLEQEGYADYLSLFPNAGSANVKPSQK